MKLHWFICFCIIGSMVSCYENVEGCLDTFASNFDVGADDDCSDCCIYPAVTLNIEAYNGIDSSYSIIDTIVNNLGHKFKIIEGKFYLSGFTIIDDGKTYINVTKISDSLTNAFVVDNVILMRVQDKSVSLPGFKYVGMPDTIKFGIGLNDSLRNGNFPNLDSTHPLSSRNILQDTTRGLTAFSTIKWANIKASKADTLSLVLVDSPFFYPKVITKIPSNRLGTDVVVKMVIDYSILFRDITPLMDTKSAEAVFRRNISDFFYVK